MRLRRRLLAPVCLVAVWLLACSPATPAPNVPAGPGAAGGAGTPAGGQSPPAIPTAVPVLPAASPAAVTSPAAGAAAPGVVGNAPAPRPGGDLIFGQDSEPDILDPHVSGSRHAYIDMVSIFDTLLAQADDLSFKPWLAERWEISPDNLSYTFFLKKGVKFHDGTPFTAAAVKFSFDRIVDPATRSLAARSALGPYKSSEVVDDYTLRLNLSQPFGPLFDGLSQPTLVPVSPAAVQKWGTDFGEHPVGTGPYMFKEWVKKDHVTLVKNPDYNWPAPIFKHTGPGYVDTITFKFISEDATRVATVETGETNIINTVPPEDWERLKSDAKYRTLAGLLTGKPYGFEFNTKLTPTNDLKVRQAIEHAVDKNAINRTLFRGQYVVAHGPLAQPTFGYEKAVEGIYPYDPARAKALLDEAGWAPGPDGVRVKDGQRLRMVWGTIIDTRPAEQIQAQLKEVGFEVEVRNLPLATQTDICQRGADVNTCMLRYVTGDPDVIRITYHSRNIGAGFNWSFFDDPTFDKLLEDAAGTTDLTKRKELYSQAQRTVMSQALTLPLFISAQLMVTRGEVYDVRLDTRGNTPWLYDAYIAR